MSRRFPTLSAFFYGCVGEAILEATPYPNNIRNFSGPHYFVNNEQGEDAVVLFVNAPAPTGCYGLLSCTDPWRDYDLESHLGKMPEHARDPLRRLAEEFRFVRGVDRPTGAFYSNPTGRLAATESFEVLDEFGFWVLKRERLGDEAWINDILDEAHYDGEETAAIRAVTTGVIDVANRYTSTGQPVPLSIEVMEKLFGPPSSVRDEAIEALTDSSRYAKLIEPS